MSARNSSSVACSAAVRTIRPCSAGLTRSRMPRSRLRTSSGRRLEMPYVFEFGISTTNRPGSETSCVRRAPLAPIGFLVTWQMMSWRARRMSSIRASSAFSSMSSASYWTSPRYSTAFFGVAMSTNAASMPGSTFWTRPT